VKVGELNEGLSLKEWPFVLFGEQICPCCDGELKACKEIVGGNLRGQDVTYGESSVHYDRVVKHKKAYRCVNCRRVFTVAQLIEKRN